MRHSTQEENDDYEAMLERKSVVLVSEKFERLKAENDRLHNLLQEAVNELLEDCGDCWGGLCEDCECWVADSEGELRALGIEVEP